MHFNVSGPLNDGVVNLHMTRRPGEEFTYRYLTLDIKGHDRVWIENAEKKADSHAREKKIFGIRWS